MRKKLSFALMYICLLASLTLGGYLLLFAPREGALSESENRMLRSFPALTAAGLADGSFMDSFEGFLSDAVPGRDGLIRFSGAVMGLFGSEDEDARTREAVEEEMGLTDDTPPEDLIVPVPGAAAETSEDAAPPAENVPTGVQYVPGDAALWYVRFDGSREVTESYSADHIAYLAGVLNRYAQALPEGGQVFFINAPASDFANPLTDGKRYADWGYDLDEIMEPLLRDNVRIYDATEIFTPYRDTEILYSDTDFHWTVRAAWHVSSEFIRDLGYAPTEYYDYEYWLSNHLKNGPYTPEQLKSMTVGRDELMIPRVNAPADASLISRLNVRRAAELYDFSYHKYTIYLGGARGPYRLFETGYRTGHNALVISDSYGFSLLYYLFPYYDSILQTDLRNTNYQPEQVGASIRRYMEEYDIDDVYFITCTWTSVNGSVFSWRAERFLDAGFDMD